MSKIGIVGAGAWGTALAAAMVRAGNEVVIQALEPEVAEAINKRHENPIYLPGVALDASIRATTKLAAAIDAEMVLLVAPAQYMRAVGEAAGPDWRPGVPAVICAKGIERDSCALMSEVIAELAELHGEPGSVEIEISVPGGAEMALKTWNPRLGIAGGISILGTTGVVIPYSCSAWIHSIHSGIDVARATGLSHVAGCTGSTSERAVQTLYGMIDGAMLDMGDFAGGMLKYLRRNPIPKLTIGGGFGKLSKLARGHLDLHSGRSQVDFDWLAEEAVRAGAAGGLSGELAGRMRGANTANEILALAREAGIPLAGRVAALARETAGKVLEGEPIEVEVLIFDREGGLAGRCGFGGDIS